MVRAAADDGPHGPAQAQRIERLDDPALGAAAPGQVHVGDAVEEHQHRDVGQPATRRVEPQRHRHGHAAHRPDLEVEDPDVERLALRRALLDDAGHVTALRGHRERHVGATDGGDDLLDEPVGVRGQQHLHVPECTGRRQSGGEQVAADLAEPVEIVDVARQQRHLDERGVTEQLGERGQLVTGGFGERPQLGDVAPQRGDVRRPGRARP